MQVLPGVERFDEARVLRQVRHDAHLDLAVVGGEQQVVPVADDESVSDLPARVGAHRDVLQVRFGGREPAGRGDGLVERGVDSAVVGHRLDETVDGRLHLGGLAVREQMLEEGMFGLLEQVLEGVRVGGVPRLGLLRLRHLEVVEQHHLQLFGRPKVDLFADHLVCGVRGGGHVGCESGLQIVQVLGVDGDPGGFEFGEHLEQRKFHVGEQLLRFDRDEFGVERLGQIHDRACAQDLGLGGLPVRGVLLVEQRQLLCPVIFRAQFPFQIAQRQIIQFEAALPGTHEIGGEGGVAGDAGEGPSASTQRVDRGLRLVQGLPDRGIGEPRGERGVVVRCERLGDDVSALAVGPGDRDRGRIAPVGRAGPGHRQAVSSSGRGVVGQPGGEGTGFDDASAHLESFVRFGFGGREGVEQSIAQHPEFEVVEQSVDAIAIPRGQCELLGCVGQRHVAHHLGELPVEQHVREVLAQRVPGLSAHLVDAIDEVGEAPELTDPLGRRLLAHAGDAGQIVARIPAQRGEVRVLGGGESVLLLDGLGGEPGQLRHAALRVQHGDVIGDQLQCVAISGDDEHPIPERGGLRREGRDDVVGLVALLRHHRDAHRVEDILGDVDLPLELVGRGTALRLVRRVQFGAERLAAHIECRGDVCGLLVAQQVDQHRREPVHRVGGLAAGGAEVLGRQRVEGAERERVPVEKQQGRAVVGGRGGRGRSRCTGHGCQSRDRHRREPQHRATRRDDRRNTLVSCDIERIRPGNGRDGCGGRLSR